MLKVAQKWIKVDVINMIVIPQINFPVYLISILVAILSGMAYIYISLKKDNIKDRNILLFFLLYCIFALVFGKMYTFLTDPTTNSLFKAGLSSYGGLVGVVLAAIIFEKILPLDKKVIKYTILSLPLVYGISKIGCFLVGCCEGIPYNGFLSVRYPYGLNINLFPVQLLESIVFIIIFLICNNLKNKNGINYITLLVCSTIKLLLDFLRYIHVNEFLSTNQIFSLLVILIISILFILKIKPCISKYLML